MHVFFSDDVLWRNYLISRVALVPRNLEKKTPASYNNTMEDYEYKVSNYMQLCPMIISRFTSKTN